MLESRPAGQYAAHAACCAAAAAGYACRAWRGEFRDWSERALHDNAWVCAEKAAQSASFAATVWSENVDAALVAGWLVGQLGEGEVKVFDAAWRSAKAAQANLLRDIAGSPFRPPPFIAPAVLACHGATVPKLARAIYDTRDFDLLPVLAEALEEAGCTDPDMMAHCRGPGPHVLGCWVLNVILA